MNYPEIVECFNNIMQDIGNGFQYKKEIDGWISYLKKNSIHLERLNRFLKQLDYVTKRNKENFRFQSFGNEVLEEERWLFILALLIHAENLKKVFVEMGLSNEIFKDTVQELFRKMEIASKEGKPIYDINYNWLIRIFSFNIIQVGRLQFGFGRLEEPLYVLQNQLNKQIRMFMLKQCFDEEGYIEELGIEKKWISEFEEKALYFEGTEIAHDGRFKRKKVFLNKDEWKIISKPGDSVVEVHIPNGGKLEIKECLKSFSRFEELSKKMRYAYSGYVCRSWLMGGSLQPYVKKNCNIDRFRNLFILYPHKRSDNEIWKRVFKLNQKPDENYIPITTLQKDIINAYREGRRIFGGAGFKPCN